MIFFICQRVISFCYCAMSLMVARLRGHDRFFVMYRAYILQRLDFLAHRRDTLSLLWRDGRAVEGARLESVYTLTRIEGSNPSLSAILAPDVAEPLIFKKSHPVFAQTICA